MKKYIIILVIFSIVAVGATYFLIDYTNKKNVTNVDSGNNITNNNITNNNAKPVVPDNLGIKSVAEKYNENPIKFVSNSPVDNIDNFNFSIDGLKDKQVQTKINNNIKNEIAYVENNSSVEEISVEVIGNFANILSLKISSIDIAPLAKGSVIRYLTIDLSTGEKIDFNDLFTNTADVKEMLTSGIYNGIMSKNKISNYDEYIGSFRMIYEIGITLADRKGNGNYGESNELEKIFSEDYYKINPKVDDIEEETIYILRNIENAKELNFCISPKFITVFINNTFIPINMIVYRENIAIYNRFKANNNIYDGTVENAKDMYVFSDMNAANKDYYIFNNDLIVKRTQ